MYSFFPGTIRDWNNLPLPLATIIVLRQMITTRIAKVACAGLPQPYTGALRGFKRITYWTRQLLSWDHQGREQIYLCHWPQYWHSESSMCWSPPAVYQILPFKRITYRTRLPLPPATILAQWKQKVLISINHLPDPISQENHLQDKTTQTTASSLTPSRFGTLYLSHWARTCPTPWQPNTCPWGWNLALRKSLPSLNSPNPCCCVQPS